MYVIKDCVGVIIKHSVKALSLCDRTAVSLQDSTQATIFQDCLLSMNIFKGHDYVLYANGDAFSETSKHCSVRKKHWEALDESF